LFEYANFDKLKIFVKNRSIMKIYGDFFLKIMSSGRLIFFFEVAGVPIIIKRKKNGRRPYPHDGGSRSTPFAVPNSPDSHPVEATALTPFHADERSRRGPIG
jgi:hypothetical protein